MSIERRLHPRASVDIPVELINCMGETAQGKILNLSEGGMLVVGDGSLDRLNHAMAGVELELSLCFQLQGEMMRCDAKVCYVRRRSQQDYQLGLEFTWLDEFSRRLLKMEVDRFLSSPENTDSADKALCI